jgi:hypothetical protein
MSWNVENKKAGNEEVEWEGCNWSEPKLLLWIR